MANLARIADLFDEESDDEFRSTKPRSRHQIPKSSFTRYNPFNSSDSRSGQTSGGLRRRNATMDPNRGRGLLPKNFRLQSHADDVKELVFPHHQEPVFLSLRRPAASGPDAVAAPPMMPEYRILLDPTDMPHPFCEEGLYARLSEMKSEFDELDLDIFRDARNRSNPYDKLKNSLFQNRSAIILAALDAVANLTPLARLQTGQAEQEKQQLAQDRQGHKMFFFADICGGPGGATEYLYWRFNQHGRPVKGFGFTVRESDFRTERFHPGAHCDNFEISYGTDGSGDIYNSENIRHFGGVVDQGTRGRGVDLATCDGMVMIQNDYNKQEILTKQIVVCEVLMGMYVLRQGGTLVVKAFDMFHQFAADLLYLIHQSFEKVTIVKPHSSRVANSERYIVAVGLLQKRPDACNFLFRVNEQFNRKENVVSLFRTEDIQKNEAFARFFEDSVNALARQQHKSLQMIKWAVEDEQLTLRESQFSLQEHCFNEWNIPQFDPETSARAVGGLGGSRGRRGRAYTRGGRSARPYQRGYVRGRAPSGPGYSRGGRVEANVWEDGKDFDPVAPQGYVRGDHGKRPRGGVGPRSGQPPLKLQKGASQRDVHDSRFHYAGETGQQQRQQQRK